MVKVNKIKRRSKSSQHHVSSSSKHKKRKCSRDGSKKKDWKNASCSVCMEHPHNAVLLLCSSYNKNCRPYICDTSTRYSNCLDRYKESHESSDILCPLCRGQVKGWAVVDLARKYLNSKKRICMQENCSFIGSYIELRKHVRVKHPLTRPTKVDPSLVEKWKKLEHETELNDVLSTIRSTMPGAIVMGDYVVEAPSHYSMDYFSSSSSSSESDSSSSSSESESEDDGFFAQVGSRQQPRHVIRRVR